MKRNKIIYSINIEDVQKVAQQELSRQLTDKELKLVEDNIGGYLNGFEAIVSVIDELDIYVKERL
jgi:gamma-glutamyl phosphate reductase